MDLKSVFIGSILTVIVAWCFVFVTKSTFTDMDNLEKRLYKNHMYDASQYFPNFSGNENRIRKNISKNVDTFFDVLSDVRWVHISKTVDTKTYVIEFTSADSMTQASLWLDSNNEVNSISPY